MWDRLLVSGMSCALWACSADKATPVATDTGSAGGPVDSSGGDTGSGTVDSGTGEDADGDGHAADDCDDTDPWVHPGATERCNDLDDDCDGEVDEDGAVLLQGDDTAHASLQDAVDAAQDGDTIWLCPGEVAGPVSVSRALTIEATQHGATALVGDGDGPVVHSTAAYIGLIGLEIRGGDASSETLNCGGGVAVSGGGALLVASRITGNHATYGGGLCATDGASVVLEDTVVRFNEADEMGGGVFLYDGLLQGSGDGSEVNDNDAPFGGGVGGYLEAGVDQVKITGNTADLGGGIGHFALEDDGGVIAVSDTVLTANQAGAGGGIYVDTSGAVFYDVTLDGNTADGAGGGLRLVSDGGAEVQLWAEGLTATDNQAATGGAIASYRASLDLDGATLTGNAAVGTADGEGLGGAIAHVGTTGDAVVLDLRDATLSDNTADSAGGAIVGYLAQVAIEAAALTGNTAVGSGGAVALYGSAEGGEVGQISSSTLLENHAARGGAILVSGGRLSLDSTWVSDNTADQEGGGIALSDTVVGGRLTVTEGGITGNTCGTTTTACTGGGGVSVDADFLFETVDADLGTGASDNDPDDVWLAGPDLRYTAFGTVTTITCSGSGTCE